MNTACPVISYNRENYTKLSLDGVIENEFGCPNTENTKKRLPSSSLLRKLVII